MKEIRHPSLGETWLALCREVCQSGSTIGQETRELLTVCAAFDTADFRLDPLLTRFASSHHVEEMRKVFFSSEPNHFGHSYAAMLSGPLGRNDLSDVAELLALDPESKRAVVSLTGSGNGKVPCVNVIHFLQREAKLLVVYFARGQDVFRKFYADALCIFEMAQRVACQLGIPVAQVVGIIGSAHVYLRDLPEIERVLAQLDGGPPSTVTQDEERK
jgi:thymidylate synthase